MNQTETANRFIKAMCDAEGKLSIVKKKIDSHKKDVFDLMNRFSEEQKQIINSVNTEIKTEDSRNIFREYKDVLEKTIELNKSKHEEYVKGTEFITKFEETFIVSVFGKVKSGKSYLGNYIMGNAFKKYNVPTEYDNLGEIEVNVYDRGKLSKKNLLSENADESEGQGFGVASTEATSTIQYFKIGGLTWFDTPGIGSITKENEELAEEYIKNSDLVVFAMNSDAAGTQQEINELTELYEMGKPMLLLVTQSDTIDWDWDESGNNMIAKIIPKSPKDREDVEKYIVDTLKEKGVSRALELSGGKVLTISAKLAWEALKDGKDDAELYKGSNLEVFINRLIDITEGEAAKLKERNPKDRFNKLISELLFSIDEFDKKVKEINDDAKLIIERVDIIKENVIANVRYHSYGIIHDKVAKASEESKNTGNKISGKEIASKVSAEINNIIKRECMEGMKDLIPDVSSKLMGDFMNGSDMNIADLGDKKVVQSYEVTVKKRQKVARGFGGKILDFILGEKYETVPESQTRTIEFSVGNNASAVEGQLLKYFEDICLLTIQKMIKNITEGCTKPFEIIYNEFTKLTELTKNELENLKIK